MLIRPLPLTVAVLLVASLPAAAADRRQAPRDAAFSGECELVGVVRFDPPLTTTPQPGGGVATATGLCSGTITEADGRVRQVVDRRARYRAADRSDTMSCQGGVAEGAGTLVVAGRSLPFDLLETRAGAVSELQLTAPRWTGSGVAAADRSDPVALAQQCAAEGIASVPITIRLRAVAG